MPDLDLDALRDELQRYCVEPWKVPGVISRCLSVLALIDEQRDRISTLEEERDKWRRLYVAKMNEGLAFAIETAETYPADEAPELHAALRDLGEALAGSPAENKDQ